MITDRVYPWRLEFIETKEGGSLGGCLPLNRLVDIGAAKLGRVGHAEYSKTVWRVFCGGRAVKVIEHFFLQRKQQRETVYLAWMTVRVGAWSASHGLHTRREEKNTKQLHWRDLLPLVARPFLSFPLIFNQRLMYCFQ